jgi:predicted HTH domain antitoxin
MSERLSIVISSELNNELESLQKTIKMDKSTLVRYLLDKSIKDVKIQLALDEFSQDKVSFGKAAEIAGISIWEFIEVCHTRKIQIPIDEFDAEFGISKVRALNIKKYKEQIQKKD